MTEEFTPLFKPRAFEPGASSAGPGDFESGSSSIKFTRSAKGVIQPEVKVYANDMDEGRLKSMLTQAQALYLQALEFSDEHGSKP
jgi:hypothetical protein